MRRAHAATVVAVEIFVEKHVIFEVRIAGQFRVTFENRALAVLPAQEQAREPSGQFIRNFTQRCEPARSGGALDFSGGPQPGISILPD